MGKSCKTIATRATFFLLFYCVGFGSVLSTTVAAASAGSSSPLTIPTSELPAGTVGVSYAATLTATGGISPYTWRITTGRLPAGLRLAATTGTISGTPTTSGSYSFGVRVTDSSPAMGSRKLGKTATATVTLSIAGAPVTPTALTITTSSLPSGTKGTPYSNALLASGGTSPYSWSITAGTFPQDSPYPTTGLLSGTPTASGTSSFTATSQTLEARHRPNRSPSRWSLQPRHLQR